MSFKDFTLPEALRQLELSFDERSLFHHVAERPVRPWLAEMLADAVPLALAINNEKARSELLITPILFEVRQLLNHRVGLFSGVELAVDEARGLTGVCDFVLSRSPQQMLLRAPGVTVVEAKQENIKSGLGQCAAEMMAARIFNEREGHPISVVHGAVTTGDEWRFMSLADGALTIDADAYLILQTGKILGILCSMLEG